MTRPESPHSVPTETGVSTLPCPVFLTGATGFIGRRLVSMLLDARCEVAALVHPEETYPLPPEVRTFVGDVTDGVAVGRAVESVQPAGIVHLAAIGTANIGLPMRDACRGNVDGVIALLEATRRVATVRRVVMIGTSYEYGARRSDDALDPFNPYSASKVAAWAFARAAYNSWKTPLVWVRPFQVYGPGQHRKALIPSAIYAALHDADFPMTGGEQQRDFVYVDDVARGLIAALRAPHVEGRALDLGTGTLYRVLDVVERIWALTQSRGRIQAGALSYRPGEVSAIPANAHRTRMLTGWEAAVKLDEGLRLTIDHVAEAEHV